MEDIHDEIEALQAIYAGDGEFELIQEGDGMLTDTVLRVAVRLVDVDPHVELSLTVTLRPPYPAIIPQLSLTSPHLTRNQAAALKARLISHCTALTGTPMVMDLVTCVKEGLSKYFIEPSKAACDVGTNESCAPLGTCLLRLDHMRARARYVKTVQRWAGELALTGRLIFFVEKLILIVLQGQLADIKEYGVRQRTVAVDVDSKGRSCKERMVTILTEQHLEQCLRSATFEVEECQTVDELSRLFEDLNLTELYMGHVYPLIRR